LVDLFDGLHVTSPFGPQPSDSFDYCVVFLSQVSLNCCFEFRESFCWCTSCCGSFSLVFCLPDPGGPGSGARLQWKPPRQAALCPRHPLWASGIAASIIPLHLRLALSPGGSPCPGSSACPFNPHNHPRFSSTGFYAECDQPPPQLHASPAHPA